MRLGDNLLINGWSTVTTAAVSPERAGCLTWHCLVSRLEKGRGDHTKMYGKKNGGLDPYAAAPISILLALRDFHRPPIISSSIFIVGVGVMCASDVALLYCLAVQCLGHIACQCLVLRSELRPDTGQFVGVRYSSTHARVFTIQPLGYRGG